MSTWQALRCPACDGAGIRFGGALTGRVTRSTCPTCKGSRAVKVDLDALPALEPIVEEEPKTVEPKVAETSAAAR